MSNSNGHSQKTLWMDKALEGSPPETKARVLEIILKYGIDPADEFFIIFVALGQLQVLIEDSPHDWQLLFENFHADLNQWTATNLTTLEAQKKSVSTTESLALTSKELTNSLTGLINVTATLVEQLRKSDQNSNWSPNKLSSLKNLLESNLNALKNSQEQLSYQVSTLSQKQTSRSRLNWANLIPWAGICLLILTCFGLLQSQQQSNALKLKWLLEKANRMDCRTGILPPTNPICKGL